MKKFLIFFIRLIECFLIWEVRSSNERELEDSNVILAQSFGMRADSPGKSNEALAKIVRDLYERFQLPVIAQKEIASANCLSSIPKMVIYKHRQPRKYLDTLEVLHQSKSLCELYRYGRKVILVAHPKHLWRVSKKAEKMGSVTRVANTKSVPYDPLSKQWFTRNFFFFLIREIPVRIFSLIRGWI